MKHPDERTIEMYYLQAESVSPQAGELASHLEQCAVCFETYTMIREYYEETEIERVPQMLHRTFAYDRRELPPFREQYPTVSGSALARFVASLRAHPALWSAGSVALGLVAMLVFWQLRPRDINPAFARPQTGDLVVYNRDGEQLWRKHIGPLIQPLEAEPYLQADGSYGAPVRDIDRDGINEVFGIFGWFRSDSPDFPGAEWRNVLVCFNADGSERWKYSLHREITLGDTRFSDDWRFYQIRVADFDGDGIIDVYGFASHIPWYPNLVVRLEAKTGALVHEYWHNGMLPWVLHRDLDGDGVQELVMGGQNNRFTGACLAVLDSRQFGGHGPAPPGLRPLGVSAAREKAYILFPASDLKPYWADVTNEVIGMSWKADSTLEVIVRERVGSFLPENPGAQGSLYYYFDRTLRCLEVRASDGFSAMRAHYAARGYVQGTIDSRYLENLRSSVLYWNGTDFSKRHIP